MALMRPLQRLYQTKLMLLATLTTVVGVAVLFLAQWATSSGPIWLQPWPLSEIRSTTELYKDAGQRLVSGIRN
jgi:hypothetical protein